MSKHENNCLKFSGADVLHLKNFGGVGGGGGGGGGGFFNPVWE